jgi:hypothetical protein
LEKEILILKSSKLHEPSPMKVFCALYHLYFHVLHKIWITLDWTFCSMMLEHIQDSLKK